MRDSPMARTRAWLKERGIVNTITEKFNHLTNRREDLFGFADVLALAGYRESGERFYAITAIQVTTQSNAAARVTKILTERRVQAYAWLLAGGRIEVWGWRKVLVKRGGKARRWQPLIREINLMDFHTELFS